MNHEKLVRLCIAAIVCSSVIFFNSCQRPNKCSNQFFLIICPENCEVYDKRDLLDSSKPYDSDCIIQFIPQKKANSGGIQPYFRLKYNPVPEKTDPDIPVYTIPDDYSVHFTSHGIDWEILPHMTINFADVLISVVNKKTGETLTGYAFAFPDETRKAILI